jgi:hypothetical protein
MKVNTKKEQHWLWDAEAEVLIALLVKRLHTLDKRIDMPKTTRDLNYKFLRKKLTTTPKNCTATALQRYYIGGKK